MSLDHAELRGLQQIVTVLQGNKSVISYHDVYLPNLLQELLRLVQHGVYVGSHFVDFIEACLGHDEEQPHETLRAIQERTDLSREEATKLYLIFSLSAREPLYYVVDRCCSMKDILQAYYDPAALLCDDMFVSSFVAVLRSISRLNFIGMDICVMPCYSEEPAPISVALPVARADSFSVQLHAPPPPPPLLTLQSLVPPQPQTVAAKTAKMTKVPKERKPEATPKAEARDATTQTWVADGRSVGMQTIEWEDPREEAYRQRDAEFVLRSQNLMQRETAVEATRVELESKQTDLETQLFALTNTVRSLKTLYDELFNRARVGDSLTESKLNELIPTIIHVLNGGAVTVEGKTESPKPSRAGVHHTSGGVPLITFEAIELPVSEQLRLQGGHCASETCTSELKEGGAWDVLGVSISKPRRCHYSGQLYCAQCHTRKTAIIPGKVIHRWDFQAYRVCDSVHTFLTNSHDDPLYDVGSLQPSLYTKIARLQACLALRSQLVIIGEVIRRCKDIRSSNSMDLTLHFFTESELYSLSELRRAGSGELVQELKVLRDECVKHILQTCALCRSRTVRRCAACSGDDQIYIFDTKNVIRCLHCKEAYHVPCFDVVGCKTQIVLKMNSS